MEIARRAFILVIRIKRHKRKVVRGTRHMRISKRWFRGKGPSYHPGKNIAHKQAYIYHNSGLNNVIAMGVVTSCLDGAYGSGLPGDVQRITRYRRHSDMQPITRKKKRKLPTLGRKTISLRSCPSEDDWQI